jgi:uncharacterized protein (DUF2062 family)
MVIAVVVMGAIEMVLEQCCIVLYVHLQKKRKRKQRRKKKRRRMNIERVFFLPWK